MRIALSAIPVVSDRRGAEVRWFHDNSSQNFAKLQWIDEKLMILSKHRRWFHSSLENFLWSECQQVGSRRQHIWFGSWSPNKFCQTTNKTQLCGFLTRVSLSDFCLHDHLDHSSLNFKSVQLGLALRRMCACENVVHIRHVLNISVSLLFGFGCASRTVSCLASVARRWVGCFGVSWSGSIRSFSGVLNATHLSPHPKNREQVIHPFAVQHPTKWFLIL